MTRCCEASPASQRSLAVAVIAGIVYEATPPRLAGDRPHFGIGFITTNDWNPVTERFGAAPFIYGTLVTSFGRAPLRDAALDRDLDLPD